MMMFHSRKIFWFVVLLHAFWGAMLLFSPVAGRATPVHEVTALGGAPYAGLLFLLASAAALGRFVVADMPYRIMAVIPQQILLLISAGGALAAMIAGHYSDGTVVARSHLIVDQSVYIFIAGFHFFVVLDEARQ